MNAISKIVLQQRIFRQRPFATVVKSRRLGNLSAPAPFLPAT